MSNTRNTRRSVLVRLRTELIVISVVLGRKIYTLSFTTRKNGSVTRTSSKEGDVSDSVSFKCRK